MVRQFSLSCPELRAPVHSNIIQSNPDLPCNLGKGKMHGVSGETINRGIITINLLIRLVFGGEETGTVYRGKR